MDDTGGLHRPMPWIALHMTISQIRSYGKFSDNFCIKIPTAGGILLDCPCAHTRNLQLAVEEGLISPQYRGSATSLHAGGIPVYKSFNKFPVWWLLRRPSASIFSILAVYVCWDEKSNLMAGNAASWRDNSPISQEMSIDSTNSWFGRLGKPSLLLIPRWIILWHCFLAPTHQIQDCTCWCSLWTNSHKVLDASYGSPGKSTASGRMEEVEEVFLRFHFLQENPFFIPKSAMAIDELSRRHMYVSFLR